MFVNVFTLKIPSTIKQIKKYKRKNIITSDYIKYHLVFSVYSANKNN